MTTNLDLTVTDLGDNRLGNGGGDRGRGAGVGADDGDQGGDGGGADDVAGAGGSLDLTITNLCILLVGVHAFFDCTA